MRVTLGAGSARLETCYERLPSNGSSRIEARVDYVSGVRGEMPRTIWKSGRNEPGQSLQRPSSGRE